MSFYEFFQYKNIELSVLESNKFWISNFEVFLEFFIKYKNFFVSYIQYYYFYKKKIIKIWLIYYDEFWYITFSLYNIYIYLYI